jgi:hypothetical protein
MTRQKNIGIRQLLAPAAAIALIAGGIAVRPSTPIDDVVDDAKAGVQSMVASFLCPPESEQQVNVVTGNFNDALSTFERHAQGGQGNWVTASPRTSVVQLKASKSDEDGTFELTIKNGEISAKINGKEVGEDRIRRNGNTVELLDDDGDVAAKFNVGGDGANVYSFVGEPRWVTLPGFQEAPATTYSWSATGDVSPPKVMLGVTMSDAPPEVLRYLDSGAAHGIVFDRVMEGLPAAKAGLEARDIVIRIDGADEATQEKLRAMLRKKEAGDKIRVKVIRKGDQKDFTINLEKYDPEKLGITANVVTQFGPEGQFFGGEAPDFDAFTTYSFQHNDEAMKALQEALEAVKGVDNEQVHKAIEEAMKSLEEKGGAQHPGGFTFEVAPNIRLFTDAEGDAFAMPKDFTFAPKGFEPGKFDEYVDATTERTSELEDRIAELEAKINRLEKLIEKLSDQ